MPLSKGSSKKSSKRGSKSSPKSASKERGDEALVVDQKTSLPSHATHQSEGADEGYHALSQPLSVRDKFSRDLDVLFEAALLAGNFVAALKAKELIGKERGFFKPPSDKTAHTLDIEALSLKELDHMVANLENQFLKDDVKS